MLVKIHDGTDSLAHLIRSYLGGYDGFGDLCKVLWFFEPMISNDKSLDDCDVMIINSKDVTKNMNRNKLLIIGEDITNPIRQKQVLDTLENYKKKNNIKSITKVIKNELKEPVKQLTKQNVGTTKLKTEVSKSSIITKKVKSEDKPPVKSEKPQVNSKIKTELVACDGDFDKLVKVAVNYGVEKEICNKYKHLSKGLLVMNIENRIKSKLSGK